MIIYQIPSELKLPYFIPPLQVEIFVISYMIWEDVKSEELGDEHCHGETLRVVNLTFLYVPIAQTLH